MSLIDSIKNSFGGNLTQQASNPLQLLVNPMAVGTVGLTTLKEKDNQTGWFSNLFKGGGSRVGSGPDYNALAPATSDPNTKYYVIGAVIVIIILLVITRKPKTT